MRACFESESRGHVIVLIKPSGHVIIVVVVLWREYVFEKPSTSCYDCRHSLADREWFIKSCIVVRQTGHVNIVSLSCGQLI